MRGNEILTPCMQAIGDCKPYNPCGPGCAVEWTNCDDEECAGKGPSIYYVIQIWGPGRPLPPYCNIVINWEDPPPMLH